MKEVVSFFFFPTGPVYFRCSLEVEQFANLVSSILSGCSKSVADVKLSWFK